MFANAGPGAARRGGTLTARSDTPETSSPKEAGHFERSTSASPTRSAAERACHRRGRRWGVIIAAAPRRADTARLRELQTEDETPAEHDPKVGPHRGDGATDPAGAGAADGERSTESAPAGREPAWRRSTSSDGGDGAVVRRRLSWPRSGLCGPDPGTWHTVEEGERMRTALKVLVHRLSDSTGFLASCPDLQGCHAEGRTLGDAIDNLQDVARSLLELRVADGLELPNAAGETGAALPLFR